MLISREYKERRWTSHELRSAQARALELKGEDYVLPIRIDDTDLDFCHANDPHEEHDFGSFEADGQTIFFKIDYYDKSLTYHSPDAADRSVTERVITIMLAEEY